MSFSIDVKIPDAVKAKLEEMKSRLVPELMKVLEARGQELALIAASLSPHKTGALQRDIKILQLSEAEGGVVLRVGSELEYALAQEVNESYKHETGRQAHYLREPFFNLLPSIVEDISQVAAKI